MIKAVLFDLDNTLVDFVKMKHQASEAAVSAMVDAGLNIHEEKGIRKLFQMYKKHGFENQKIFNKFIKQEHGFVDYKLLANAIVAYRKVRASHVQPYPHTRQVLLNLRDQGIKIGIVSDAPKLQAWTRLVELNLQDFFNVVIAVGGTGKEKPNAIPFRQACQKLKIPASEILFVGDNPKRDIQGAQKVGMKTALAKYGQFAFGKSKADYVIKNINDILNIVKKENKN
ncbi:MAG: HAD-IIIA family hydrolase [Candidatus Diapherotrites archaeon]|nr:HAD-IIIA family hydrolase [Candidatus Diapherotrites archaeon]